MNQTSQEFTLYLNTLLLVHPLNGYRNIDLNMISSDYNETDQILDIISFFFHYKRFVTSIRIFRFMYTGIGKERF